MIQHVCSSPDIYRILVPLPGNPLRSVNCFLVRAGGESLLIDTGFNCQEGFDALSAALAQLGVEVGPGLRLFITHAHSDHFGLADRFADLGVTVLMNPQEHAFVEDLVAGRWLPVLEQTLRESGFADADVQALLQHNPIIDGACERGFAAQHVSEGDVIEVGGWRFRCLETPGHAPGHCCLYLEERQLLVAGDCVLFRISPNIASFSGDGDNLAAYLASLQRLEALPVKELLTAHREVSGTLAQRARELQEHHAQRLQECLDVLGRERDLSCVELAERLTWSPKGGWASFPLGQRMFANGECRAHAEHLVERGLLQRRSEGGVWRYRLAATAAEPLQRTCRPERSAS